MSVPITPPVLMELTSTSVTVWRGSVVNTVRTISMNATASPVRMDSARMASMTSVVPATRYGSIKLHHIKTYWQR